MTIFDLLKNELGPAPRCDFEFKGGRLEVHSAQNTSSIFIRIAKRIVYKRDKEDKINFVPDDFIPVRECWINGAKDAKDNDINPRTLKNIISINFQNKVLYKEAVE